VSYIEILILRNLSSRPAHGYELRKRVEAVTGVVLNNNSLYPALRRFEEAGAVTRTAHEQQGRPAKQVYELTDVGRDLLHDLLADLPPDAAQDDVEFMTRLGQFAFLTEPERLAVLDARNDALAERLERLARLRDQAGSEPWSTLVTAELTERARQERQWLGGLRAMAAGQADKPVPDDAVAPAPPPAAGPAPPAAGAGRPGQR
jgi:DNA-binding PadR family transcriptional regulator